MTDKGVAGGVDTGFLAWGLLVAAAVAAVRAVALPLIRVTDPGGRVKVYAGDPVWPDAQAVADVSPLNQQGIAYLHIPDLPVGLRLLAEAGPAIGALAWAVGLALVALVVRDIGSGSPFGARVPLRLTVLAALVVVGGTARTALEWLSSTAVVDRMNLDDTVSPTYAFPVGEVLIAALVLVLAEAFRQGRRLSAELEGLV